MDNNIRVFILPGFDIARKATNQTELQLRMQGNAFLGAFFRVSPFLKTFGDHRGAVPRRRAQAVRQEVRPVRRRGRHVNMTVMRRGSRACTEIAMARQDDPDRSSMRNPLLAPIDDSAFPPTAG